MRPKASTKCKCHYSGRLVDGTEFDSSYKRGPFTTRPDEVIAGWHEAMQLMRAGDKWELYIPSNLGYGDRGAGAVIPGGAALIFEMEMLEVDVKDSILPTVFLTFLFISLFIGIGYLIWVRFVNAESGSHSSMGPAISLEDASDPENPHVFFDMKLGDAEPERIEFELFAKVAPKTVENFRALATGEKGLGRSTKPLWFKGSKFHRVIPGFMLQGGDITMGTGQGGESIYGHTFNDEWEHGVVSHTKPGLLSMANRGKDTNGSQFFITVAATPWLNKKHVVFGRVTKGMDVVKKIESLGTKAGTPKKPIEIVDCGELK